MMRLTWVDLGRGMPLRLKDPEIVRLECNEMVSR
jgi:hypothetical protein